MIILLENKPSQTTKLCIYIVAIFKSFKGVNPSYGEKLEISC